MMKSEHPNGFTVRLLMAFTNGARLRLHTWSADRSDRAGPHDHRSWFISIPLWGRFIERRYREVTGDTSTYLCRATTSSERDVTRSGQSGVEVTSEHARYPFVPYFCSADVIHSYVPLKKNFAASLVLFGPPENKIPKAWIKNDN